MIVFRLPALFSAWTESSKDLPVAAPLAPGLHTWSTKPALVTGP